MIKEMTEKEEKIEEVLTRGVDKIYPSQKAFKELLLSGKKIRVYQGFDPSSSSLHLGNLVGVLKLKQFQELGHEVVFLMGDFTGMIGDPTDKSAVRQKLSREKVLENCKAWQKQIARFLALSGKNPAKIMFNSEWLDKISFKDLIEIASNFTVGQMIQRDFFQKRIEEEKPIYLHEFLYPLAQALDSVNLNVDVEIGGSDQTFNMLCGRDLVKILKNKEKFVLTTKLLIDKEGKKVGKTTGNAVFLDIASTDMFGKIMAFPDEIIFPAFELLTLLPLKEVENLKKEKTNPLILKKKLAWEIVKINYGGEEANGAQEEFDRVFKNKELPEEISQIKIKEKYLPLLELLVKIKLASSKSEAKRLILEGGVKIDKSKQDDWQAKIEIEKGMIIQVGKRKFVKLA